MTTTRDVGSVLGGPNSRWTTNLCKHLKHFCNLSPGIYRPLELRDTHRPDGHLTYMVILNEVAVARSTATQTNQPLTCSIQNYEWLEDLLSHRAGFMKTMRYTVLSRKVVLFEAIVLEEDKDEEK